MNGVILSEKEVTASDGSGNTTSYVYSPGLQTQLTDIVRPGGTAMSGSTDGVDSTHFDYDPRGNVSKVTVFPASLPSPKPANIVVNYGYAADCTSTPITYCNKPSSIIDANSNETDITYHNSGLPFQVTLPVPSTTNPTRPRIRYTTAAWNAHYNRYGTGIVAGEQNVDEIISTATCMTGTSSSDCASTSTGAVTTIDYGSTVVTDPNNLLPITVTLESGDTLLQATTTLAWTNQGDLKSSDGPLGTSSDTTAFFYDDLRQRIGVILPRADGNTGTAPLRAVKYTYNGDRQVTRVDRGTTTGQSSAQFNAFTVRQSTQTAYSTANGAPTRTELDQTGVRAATEYEFDAAQRLKCVTVRMSNLGTPLSDPCMLVSGAPDRITQYSYDLAGRLSTTQTGFGSTEAQTTTYSYNALDQVSSISDGLLNLTSYDFDNFHRPAVTHFPSPTTPNHSSNTDIESYAYDPNSNLVNVTRRDGEQIAYTVDGLNRVTAKMITPISGVTPSDNVAYQYDNLSRMTQAKVTAGTNPETVTYSYDALSRLTDEVGPLGDVQSKYDLAGRRTKLIWPDGFYANYDYDWTGMLTAVRENNATTGDGVLANFTYDDLARLDTVARAGGAGAGSNYNYNDSAGLTPWLTQIKHHMANPNKLELDFTDNPAGQIVTRSASVDSFAWTGAYNVDRSYTNNGLNQLTGTTVGSTTTTYSYDGDANLSSDGTTSYKYDTDNRMTKAVGQVNLTYDPMGRLFKTNGTATTKYLYDGNEVIGEYDNSGTTLLRRYVRGNGYDQPLVQYDIGGSGAVRSWIIPDERGSIIAETDDAGSVKIQENSPFINSYDEYGAPGAQNLGTFQYTGQMWLPDAGLDHYKARAYSPNLGRFMQTDPVGYADSTNLYTYVLNDPVNLLDPTGLAWVCSVSPDKEVTTGTCFNDSGLGPSGGNGGSFGGEPGLGGREGKAPPPPPKKLPDCNTILPNGETVGERVRDSLALSQVIGSINPASKFGADLAMVAPYGPLDPKNNFRGQAPAGQLADAGNFAVGAYMTAVWGSGVSNLAAVVYASGSNLLGIKSSQFMAPNGMDKSAAANLPRGNANAGCPGSH